MFWLHFLFHSFGTSSLITLEINPKHPYMCTFNYCSNHPVSTFSQIYLHFFFQIYEAIWVHCPATGISSHQLSFTPVTLWLYSSSYLSVKLAMNVSDDYVRALLPTCPCARFWHFQHQFKPRFYSSYAEKWLW